METRSNHVLVGAVVLAMLAALLIFTVWLAGLSSKSTRCFDIYFTQAVGGLNKGTNVTFSGVPVGKIEKISLLPDRPEFVWVRISVDNETPVLQGTTAQIKGVGFTGVSEIQLNSAPELIDRIQRLTERLSELLSDKNQNSIADILENIETTTDVLAARAPDLADAIGDARIAARNAGVAAQRVGVLADSTTQLVNEQGKPAAEDLRKAIASIQRTTDTLDAVIAEARPGLSNFSKNTLPEANRLVRDLRDLSQSLQGVSERLDQGGVGGMLGPKKLPDYKPGKTR